MIREVWVITISEATKVSLVHSLNMVLLPRIMAIREAMEAQEVTNTEALTRAKVVINKTMAKVTMVSVVVATKVVLNKAIMAHQAQAEQVTREAIATETDMVLWVMALQEA
jgi:hypothetical protein